MSRVKISELNIGIRADGSKLATDMQKAVADVRGFAKETAGVGDSLMAAKSALLGFAGVGVALAGINELKDALVSFAGEGIRLAQDLETAQLRFEVILGNADEAKQLLDGIFDFADSTPFASDELIAASQQLLAYGFNAKEIGPTLASIADIAAGTGAEMTDLAEIYGRIFSDDRALTEDLNRLNDRAIPIFKMLADQMGVSTGKVRELASAGKIGFAEIQQALAELTGEGGKFEGMTARLAESGAGRMSTLEDSIAALKREFGEGLAPATNEAIELMLDLVGVARDFGELLSGPAQLGVMGLVDSLRQLREMVLFVNLGFKKTLADFGLMSMEQFAIEAREAGNQLLRIRGLLKDEGPKAPGIDSLIGPKAPADIAAARKEVAELGKTATAAAEKIRQQFATPMDEFRESIKEIEQARIFGGLDIFTAESAIRAEIEKITSASIEAKKAMDEMRLNNPLVRRGSQEDFAAQDRAAIATPDEAIKRLEETLRLIVDDTRADQEQLLAKSSESDKEGSEKVVQEIAKQSAIDRAVLHRIAGAVERNKPTQITVREFGS